MRARQVGIEEEFLVFDGSAPHLLDAGPRIVADAARSAPARAQFEKELKQAQVELATSPVRGLADLAADLTARRRELARAAARHGARLVASGTCPTGETTDTTQSERYER